jgi:hypothetical protein
LRDLGFCETRPAGFPPAFLFGQGFFGQGFFGQGLLARAWFGQGLVWPRPVCTKLALQSLLGTGAAARQVEDSSPKIIFWPSSELRRADVIVPLSAGGQITCVF